MSVKVAIDIGGTFTDLVYIDSSGMTKTEKVLSTPPKLVNGILSTLDAAGISPKDVSLFVHGTTQGLNAILERKGAKVALITTKGFRDTYIISRGNRVDMYNLHFKKPEPLISRGDIFELEERVQASGQILTKLNTENLEKITEEIKTKGYKSVAICLIHSYINSSHEKIVKDFLHKELPGVSISASYDVSPEWREYERTSTTVMSAYISPIMDAYLSDLEGELQKRGMKNPVYITSSSGGVISASHARTLAARTIFSGPVGGAVGARQLSRDLNLDNVIAADIGGTSFDVSIVRDGNLSVNSEFELAGLPIIAPAVDVNTVGAGGGSLVTTDAAGRLKVGPQSAGALPGPICYGRGGTTPTVTDANVLLGRIPNVDFFGGDLSETIELVQRAFSNLGEKFGLNGKQTAEQSLEIINYRMAEAIRELTVERGLDPRGFTLCMFGGAGGLHATAIAEELQIKKILIPRFPGNFSAWGMLQSGIRHDVVRSYFKKLDEIHDGFEDAMKILENELKELATSESLDMKNMITSYSLDLRYTGQEYSMTIPIDRDLNRDTIHADFNTSYMARYGHSNNDDEIEIVCIRGATTFAWSKTASKYESNSISDSKVANVKTYFRSELIDCEVWHRDSLPQLLNGPAIIIESTGTTFIPPDWSIAVIENGHLLISKIEKGAA